MGYHNLDDNITFIFDAAEVLNQQTAGGTSQSGVGLVHDLLVPDPDFDSPTSTVTSQGGMGRQNVEDWLPSSVTGGSSGQVISSDVLDPLLADLPPLEPIEEGWTTKSSHAGMKKTYGRSGRAGLDNTTSRHFNSMIILWHRTA